MFRAEYPPPECSPYCVPHIYIYIYIGDPYNVLSIRDTFLLVIMPMGRNGRNARASERSARAASVDNNECEANVKFGCGGSIMMSLGYQ